ncbi:phospholipid/cholesterol/gamma-HCH transport system substrate-binding protein [Amycolatopsis arida]|uniref:Phospholipid/cholesterol/gamma-HCH transport system substrate-binding protein n=1 Tax=Amycolatopsis arida TaxID=587909 RepID=A0A1I5VC51_9PSEU|nr:MlaD family protein [Amycolatopsis arida]TDX91226.1 phospholipid/cholesterol/gamma-HCH transport system substrate-binding protein [Amycolatopsis arida]SFQ05083.1 phospholipid/cholesterol/gamma-HCH transport system substrate-binding protein [Amycolatopsis arida]
MPRRSVRLRIMAFFVIAVVSVGYAGWRYAGLDRLFGHRGYLVTVELARGGGVFPGADVTYRGVSVGRVAELRLTGTAVEAVLDIEPGAPPVPAATRVVVANRSAIGEQYVDLRPDRAGEPYLADGARIPLSATTLPLPPDRLLSGARALLGGVSTESLRTVVDELHAGLAGTGDDLQRILDTTAEFLPAAIDALPRTRQLLADGRTVLGTQRDLTGPITEFGGDLRALAAQLRASDPDLRRLVDVTPPLARQVGDVLARSGSDLSVVLANLLTTATVFAVRVDALEQANVLYPYLPVIGNALFPGDGTAHMGLVLNVFHPFSCTKGYEGTARRPGGDLTDAPPNPRANCAEPPGSPTSVRGSQNAPYPGVPPAVPAPTETGAAPAGEPTPGLLGRSGVTFSGWRPLLGLPG